MKASAASEGGTKSKPACARTTGVKLAWRGRRRGKDLRRKSEESRLWRGRRRGSERENFCWRALSITRRRGINGVTRRASSAARREPRCPARWASLDRCGATGVTRAAFSRARRVIMRACEERLERLTVRDGRETSVKLNSAAFVDGSDVRRCRGDKRFGDTLAVALRWRERGREDGWRLSTSARVAAGKRIAGGMRGENGGRRRLRERRLTRATLFWDPAKPWRRGLTVVRRRAAHRRMDRRRRRRIF